MKYKVFVDGREGTTGLKIDERLAKREDIELLKIDSDKRKDTEARRSLLNEADIVFLCLPDEASRESVSLITNSKTRVLDASTAFRTSSDWAYGLPELSKNHRSLIENSKRVSVPGCHATGFNLLLYPLVQEGIVPKDYPIACHSITGYSGGGKKLIEQYEGENADRKPVESPRFYALGLNHKHLPEMQKTTGLQFPPLFNPIVGAFHQGMVVAVPLQKRQLAKGMSARETHEFLTNYYEGQHFVKVIAYGAEPYLDNGFLNATACNNTNRAELFVFGTDEQVLLLARFDNLGKGASGAAVQNMNIMLGINEATGLE